MVRQFATKIGSRGTLLQFTAFLTKIAENLILSYHEFKLNYNLICDCLTFFQVISATPRHLLKKAKFKHSDKGIFDRTNVVFHLSPLTSLNLVKAKSRDYYWLLNRVDTKTTGLIKWEKELQLVDFKGDWNYFNSIKICTLCSETKLRDFYYKLFNIIVTTKRELFFNGIASDQVCHLCSVPDSIKNTFVNCPISNSLYNEIIKWFNDENVSFYPSSLEILFGNLECSHVDGY